MKKITIVSGIQLSDNPRVVKEAATLANAGFDVEVLCSLLKPRDEARNRRMEETHAFRVQRVLDASRSGIQDWLNWQWLRLQRKAALTVYRFTARESVHQLGYAADGLLKVCSSRRADLYSLHLPQAMWVGTKLLERGATVSVDIEDWYSEDLRPEDGARSPVKLLRSNEATILQGAVFASTTSQSLSSELAACYGCRPPVVLYNAFRLSERSSDDVPPHDQPMNSGPPRIGWISQVIGPDRGLEQLAAASHHLRQPVEIHLTGRLRPGMDAQLREYLHPDSSVVFHDQVPHEELLGMIQTCDIGFAGELADNRNKDLTVSNKILHYLLAGVPAVASDTKGQLEICRQAPQATRVYAQRDPKSLAAAIDSLLESPDRLRRAKQAAWDAGSSKFCWEENESRLLDAVQNAIGPPQ